MGDESGVVREIPISRVEINLSNPRIIFDQEKLDSLLESVKEKGILVPLNVYVDENKKFTIIDGERRYRVALKLGIEKLPVIINDRPKTEDYITDMFHIHNLREPWELVPTAIKLKEVEDIFTKKNKREPTEKELSKLTGLTVSVVRRCRLVLSFPTKVQDMMLEEESKTSKEKTAVGKDRLLTEDFFIEMAKNVIVPLEKNNQKVYREVGGSKEIFDSIIQKRKGGLIKNIVALRPVAKYVRDYPIKGAQAIKAFIQNKNQTAEDLVEKVGLVFDLYKFERNMNVFYGAIDNIPLDLKVEDKSMIIKILRKIKNTIEQKLEKLR